MPTAMRYPQISIEFHRESIPVATMSPAKVPDEKWRFVDTGGHGHFWEGDQLPTLKWVVTGTEAVGDEIEMTEYEVGEYRCRICDQVVEPGKRYEYGPSFIPGLATVTVTIDREVFTLTEEQYASSVAEWVVFLRSATKREP